MISDHYINQLREVHKSKKWGNSGKSWLTGIVDFAKELNAANLIDYGCGQGTLKPNISNMDVYEYDPGIEGKDKPPPVCDMLVCTDVLEHVEPQYLLETLEYIDGLYTKGAFFVIACNAAKEILPDGRNAHLIQRPPSWWRDQFNNIHIFKDEKKRALIWTKKI